MVESQTSESLDQIVTSIQGTDTSKIGAIAMDVRAILDTGDAGLKNNDVVRGKYLLISGYLRSDAHPHQAVVSVACRCAMVLGEIDDVIEFAGVHITSGDTDQLFSVLEYLTINENGARAQGLIQQFSDSLESRVDIGSEKLMIFSQYAYACGCDDIAYNLACTIEGDDIGIEDPRILKYRKVVRNPEEFEIAISQLIVHFRGKTAYVGTSLLSSLRRYIEKQVTYLGENNAVEPEMLRYYESKLNWQKDEIESYDARVKTYVTLSLTTLLAVLFQNTSRAETLLTMLLQDGKSGQMTDILGDVVHDLELGDTEGDEDVISREDRIKDGLLNPLMGMYGGVEYVSIHTLVYQLFEKMYGTKFKDQIEGYQMQITIAMARMSKVAPFYLDIIDSANTEYSPVYSMHIRMQALQNKNNRVFEVGSLGGLALYVMWSFLYHGKFPTLAADVVKQIGTSLDDDVCIKFLKQIYCPTENPSII